MDFSWSEDQIMLRKSVIEFAQKQLKDDLIERDSSSQFPLALWKKCADFGILGIPFPEEFGGRGESILSSIYAMEALGYGCRDNGLMFGLSAQMWDVQMPILHFGTHEQKSKYLPKLSSGESIGSISMTEPQSGSDAYSITTTAEKKDDYYILNGSKTFVTNGPVADLFIVFATINKRFGFRKRFSGFPGRK